MSRSGKQWIVFFVGASILGFSGCGTKQPVTPAKSNTNANTRPSTPPETDPQSPVIGAPSTSPPTANTNPSGAQTDPKPPFTAPPKAPLKPTAEQLSKWSISEAEPLQLLACYDGFSDNVQQALAATPDGKQFVVGGARLSLWNVAEAEPLKDLLADKKDDKVERPILAAEISPDGALLVAGDNDGRLFAWKLSDHGEVFAIKAHEGRLTQLAFSPDSKTIATTSYDGEVRLWQAADGAEIKIIKGDKQEIYRLLFVSDDVLATASNSVVLWNVESGEKQATLTKGNVISPLLALSHDGRWLIHADEESKTQVWDIQTKAAADWQFPCAAHDIAFSPDGKWIATASRFAPVRIYSAAHRQVVQVLDVNGGHIVGLKWLGDSGALAIASELGRVRIWGTVAAGVKLGLKPLEQPALREIAAGARVPFSPAQLQQIVEVRALPRLPNAIDGLQYGGTTTYNAPAANAEAEMFYRHVLAKAGWEELPNDPHHPGLLFRKQGCQLDVSLSPASMSPGGRDGDLQVSLYLHGNYDVRWLPKIAPIASKSEYSSFSNLSYRSKSSLTDLEVALLKKFHELGWTPYSRLRASSAEEPLSRSFDMLQGGSVLQVSIGFPGDSSEELYVQTNVSTTNLALPIPPDAGWIEFDASTDIAMVANTKMNLQETIAFYDKEMAFDGWLAREAGRHVDEKGEKEHEAWLPYIRGQQDVVIRLVSLLDGGTRVLVGEADRSSYQLAEIKPVQPDVAKDGIEAADFKLPTGASAIQFDADEKHIEFTSADKPTKIAAQFIEQMEALGWMRDNSGFLDDEYSLLTYEKGKAEIQLRARGAKEKSTASISGDGLLWTKPLPIAAVRISYETWLRRNSKLASLEHLDEFAAEMAKIPASVKGK